MIQDTEKYLQNIKKQNILMQHRRNRRIFLFKKYSKYSLYAVLILLGSSALFFPTFTATILGNWVVNFIGTLVTIISNGF